MPPTKASPWPSGREDLAPRHSQAWLPVPSFWSALLACPHNEHCQRMWLPTQSPSPGDSQSWEWDPPSPGWELVPCGDWRCAAGPEDCPLPLPYADASRAGDVYGPEAAPGLYGLPAALRRHGQGEPVGPKGAVLEQERWVAVGAAEAMFFLTIVGWEGLGQEGT